MTSLSSPDGVSARDLAEVRQQVQDLAAALQQVQDELAILRLLTSYGFVVDGDDADACAELYSADALVTIDGTKTLAGREEIRTIVTCEAHQSILPTCAHVMGPFVVSVDGDAASATGYATVCVADGDGRRVFRQAVGRWTLHRSAGGWLVRRRESWAMGLPAGQAILRAGHASA